MDLSQGRLVGDLFQIFTIEIDLAGRLGFQPQQTRDKCKRIRRVTREQCYRPVQDGWVVEVGWDKTGSVQLSEGIGEPRIAPCLSFFEPHNNFQV